MTGQKTYRTVTCDGCALEYAKRADTIINWSGVCANCNRRAIARREDVRAKHSQDAQKQVARQGGVPNAKKFYRGMTGELAPRWKGGITVATQRHRHRADYIEWRKAVLERDAYKCVNCDSVNNLVVDHIMPCSLFPALRVILENGRTLCKPCDIILGWRPGRDVPVPRVELSRSVR